MKPRRQSRRVYARAFALTLQRLRLEGIARGELKPLCVREEFFLRALRERGRADPADFIIPHPLLLLEAMREREESEPDEPFTPDAEPAISAP
ncbi:MAG: hypothetical protein EON90_14615 [Brevundimonas sp.]|nr:MAG: hypothetical protein EON90_14615 [Brevundimonas sp.]